MKLKLAITLITFCICGLVDASTEELASKTIKLSSFENIDVSTPVDLYYENRADVVVKIAGSSQTVLNNQAKVLSQTLHVLTSDKNTRPQIKASSSELVQVMAGSTANIKLNDIHSHELTLIVRENAIVELTGKIDRLNIYADGYSKINAGNANVEEAVVSIHGKSTLNITVSNSIELLDSVLQNIKLKGNPKIY